jgi:glycosyltransferase involved in cell wall biosynthesis
MPARWHLITGEYPPDPGGVADYTALVAAGLADRGCEVHVWCGGTDRRLESLPSGVTVHRVAGRFGPGGLARLGRELNRFPGPRTLLLQYTPHAFGWKAMNLPLCLWLLGRRAVHRDDVRVMFHEVAFPFVRRPLKHNLIAVVNRAMAAVLLAAARRAYVSIPGWSAHLDRFGGRRVPRAWLPIPANVPAAAAADAATVRDRLTGGDPGAAVVGHFGTFGPGVTDLLAPALGRILAARADIRVLLVGRGADKFRAALADPRVTAADGLPADAAAAHLAACDLAVQPYPDGVSTRRTSAMAWLANGVPVVANLGPLSEPLWATDRVAAVAPSPDPAAVADLALRLLADPAERAAGGRRGRDYYDRHFAVGRTIDALVADR